MFIHGIGKDKLTALIKHYKSNGVEARTHKNAKKLPANTLSYEGLRQVVEFINNYAEIHAIPLPGRTPNHWKSDVKLLPTNCTKKSVFDEYVKSAKFEGKTPIKISLFRQLWRRLVPHICTMPPASDLCWVCQKGTARLVKSINKPDEEKCDAIKELEEHQKIVAEERKYYQRQCAEVAAQIPTDLGLGRHEPCSFYGRNHVSFDFAQQLHYPYNPLQPGPIFFKTPRKCGLFGLNCESAKQQVNICIDEAHCSGKGANTVISLLHHFLGNYSYGETDLYLHADNCAGQNKNSTMLWYLVWQCVNGLNKSITLSFLITGHTKFSPDGGFGLIKRRFKKTKVDCLKDIEDVINSSSMMNTSELVGPENGPSTIPTYDWNMHLSPHLSKLIGIKKFHHFTTTSAEPGKFECKLHVNAQSESFALCKKKSRVPSALPPIIAPNGLPLQRQWYLFNEIRPFVADEHQDTVCPRPLMDYIPNDVHSDEEETEPAPKKTKPSTKKQSASKRA